MSQLQRQLLCFLANRLRSLGLTKSHWVDSLTAYYPTTSMDSDTTRFPGSLSLLDTIASLASKSTDLDVADSAFEGIDFATGATKRYCSALNIHLYCTTGMVTKHSSTAVSYCFQSTITSVDSIVGF